MKKYFILLAAVLGMVACNKGEGVNNDEPSAPKKMVTLHATVNMGDDSANGPKRIAPDAADWSNPSATSVNFHWEVGDQVLLLGLDEEEDYTGESSVFTVTSIDETDPSKATLTGEALSDMTKYEVDYIGENPTYEKWNNMRTWGYNMPLSYQAGKSNNMFFGEGADGYFELTDIYTTIRLQIKGDAQLGKIVVCTNDSFPGYCAITVANTTLNFGTEGLQLTSTPIDITIPVCYPETDYVALTFYDKQERVVLKRTGGDQWFLEDNAGKIINFGVLEVTAAPFYAYVDLGLSVKWATMNVGATCGTTKGSWYGDYFAWGETAPKGMYVWSNYSLCNGTEYKMTKYCTSSSNGTVDNKTVLEAADDAATANWGGSWRMPTKAEQDELLNNCTWTWTTDYQGISGLNGYVVSATNGNSIFLPAAGYFTWWLNEEGSNGFYWSSSLSSDDSKYAYDLYFLSDYVDWDSHYRYYGHSVRPVCQ